MQIISDDPTGASDKLRILGEYSERMFAGDEQAVLDFWSDDFHSNVTNRVSPEAVGTDVRGQEQLYWREAQAAFPDMEFSVELLIEAGDYVVSNWTITGTHTGTAFYEVEPTGEPVRINGTAVLRFRDGKIVEHWGGPHCQRGLGLIPTP
ncbi:MAG: ester cyclase [Acidimicrobiales bacterium]